MKLNVQTFIEQHSDWERLLSDKPYCINISRNVFNGQKLVMFKYSQIDSDFSINLVKECRGLILDEDSMEVVSFPFTKFFNFGEPNATDVDWATARCGEKIDGSLVKIVNVGDNLLISTNGTILASEAPVAKQIGCRYASFGDIIVEALDEALERSGWQEKLQREGLGALWEEGYTYMFELCSPWTKVVVPHKENKLYYLGKRDNVTFEETYFTDDLTMSRIFDIPKVYPLKNVDECIAATREMPWDEEGYVVCDAKFNRVKIKSPAYLAVHSLKGEGVMSYRRALGLVKANETDEICTYFPEFKPAIEEIKERWRKLLEEAEATVAAFESWKKEHGFDTQPWLIESGGIKRKDLAAWAMKEHAKFSAMLFCLVDKRVESPKYFFDAMPIDKTLSVLGYRQK